MCSRKRLTFIKDFINNESVCHFMVVQLFKLSTKDKCTIANANGVPVGLHVFHISSIIFWKPMFQSHNDNYIYAKKHFTEGIILHNKHL